MLLAEGCLPKRWISKKFGANVLQRGTTATKPDLSFPIQNVHDCDGRTGELSQNETPTESSQ
ncbi:MAG: hypothetical protein U1A73_26450 [Pseudomonas sp.]|nr:hypothetical protein [Pseudomonas sp.]